MAVKTIAVILASAVFVVSAPRPAWVNTGDLNVRSGPSLQASKIDMIGHGHLVRVEESSLGADETWSRVSYRGRQAGWVSARFLDRSADAATVNATKLNVRSEGRPSAPIVSQLAEGTRVAVHDVRDGWCQVSFERDKGGYVSAAYLVEGEDQMIRAATADRPGSYHVEIKETITSKSQSDWLETYNATVILTVEGREAGRYKGSTLPNFRPGAGRPASWQYSVVRANCSFEGALLGRPYTWTRGLRSDGRRPCLRLAGVVPTVAIGSERIAEMTEGALVDALLEERSARGLRFARDILVHAGGSNSWRGSAGCLTIHPDDQAAFFSAIPDGTTGTLSVDRGIEDSSAQMSYCY